MVYETDEEFRQAEGRRPLSIDEMNDIVFGRRSIDDVEFAILKHEESCRRFYDIVAEIGTFGALHQIAGHDHRMNSEIDPATKAGVLRIHKAENLRRQVRAIQQQDDEIERVVEEYANDRDFTPPYEP